MASLRLENLAMVIGGFTPVIAVGAVIAAQELSRTSSTEGSVAYGTRNQPQIALVPDIVRHLEDAMDRITSAIGNVEAYNYGTTYLNLKEAKAHIDEAAKLLGMGVI